MRRLLLIFAMLWACSPKPEKPILSKALAFQDVVGFNSDGVSSFNVTGNTGGDNMFYVLAGSYQLANSITNVTGGGLTWTKKANQANSTVVESDMWVASGTPNANPFTVTVTLSSSSNSKIAGHVVRYSQVRQTNGCIDAAGNGTSSTGPATLVLSSARFGPANPDLYVNSVGVITTTATIDANYTQRGTVSESGAVKVKFCESSTTASSSHTLGASNNWTVVGGVLKGAVRRKGAF